MRTSSRDLPESIRYALTPMGVESCAVSATDDTDRG
jgi:hypothetical protein